jgi:hypothetical protein
MNKLRRRHANYLAVASGALAAGTFGLLTECGSSSGGSGDPGGNDPDAAASPDAQPGKDAAPDAGPSRTVCDAAAQCGDAGGAACCTGFCTNTTLDPTNCGSCGNACAARQFCTGVICDNAVVANLCGNPNATIVLDQYEADNEGGAAIGAALAAICTPSPNVVQKHEDAGGVTDPSDGRPITGVGNTFVTGGGGFGHIGIAYLDMMGLTPLYPQVVGPEYDVVERATGKNVITVQYASLTASHDFFYVELAVEPKSGTLALSGVGTLAPGTVAASYYLATEIIPHRTDYPNTWYLYEWTDVNMDTVPNAGDTFTMVATGN